MQYLFQRFPINTGQTSSDAMRLRSISLWTALAVIGVCGWPVWQGTNIVRYAFAVSKPELRLWTSVPGVAFSASERARTYVDDSSDEKTIAKRRDDLAHILEISPLSSIYWLKLAESRVDAHEAEDKIVAALELSTVTGPNEGYMITQRGLFGIWQWEILSPEIRARAIADLGVQHISDNKLTWLRQTLALKSEAVRQEIYSALEAQGLSKDNFGRLGR
jgi:hypothetical protein